MKLKIIFSAEIREREPISKNISKYLASLDYFDKSLNVLSILSGSISIALFLFHLQVLLEHLQE